MEEEVKGLPDMDLETIEMLVKNINVNQDKDQKVETKETKNEGLDLAQFKTPQDLLKSYKEIQAAFTRVTQDNKSTKEQMSQLKDELELSRMSVTQPMQQQQGNLDDPEVQLEQRIQRSVATTLIAEVLEEEAGKNKSEFNERYAYAKMVANEYPQLTTTGKGVRKLFELGDKLRSDQLKRSAGKALEAVFGEPLGDEEINKLRMLVKGDKAIKIKTNLTDAYMPDTSTSTRTGSDTDRKPNLELQIKDSVEKGDVDGVIKGLFKSILAE